MPWLTDTQLDSLCEGISREQKARRCKYLRGLGLKVIETPSGAPRVLISNVEAVLGGVPVAVNKPGTAAAEPDRAALMAHFGKRKKVAA